MEDGLTRWCYKEHACHAAALIRNEGVIHCRGKIPGAENGKPTAFHENPWIEKLWRAIVHRVAVIRHDLK